MSVEWLSSVTQCSASSEREDVVGHLSVSEDRDCQYQPPPPPRAMPYTVHSTCHRDIAHFISPAASISCQRPAFVPVLTT